MIDQRGYALGHFSEWMNLQGKWRSDNQTMFYAKYYELHVIYPSRKILVAPEALQRLEQCPKTIICTD